MNNQRRYSMSDQVCLSIDQAVRVVFGIPLATGRQYPARLEPEPHLSAGQTRHSAALMRVNHAGEVCAQALYHGQTLISRDPKVREKMEKAALEEGDHLAWCNERLQELHSHRSYLNPFWYAGSFIIGLTAGLWGDRWSLGFLAETEQQVVLHLQEHLKVLSSEDIKSLKVIQQIQEDEAKHRDDAIELGAKELPATIKKWMRFVSKLMVKTAARL
jgi:3-demethoxyubiquinol 3-hydroxylase